MIPHVEVHSLPLRKVGDKRSKEPTEDGNVVGENGEQPKQPLLRVLVVEGRPKEVHEERHVAPLDLRLLRPVPDVVHRVGGVVGCTGASGGRMSSDQVENRVLLPQRKVAALQQAKGEQVEAE